MNVTISDKFYDYLWFGRERCAECGEETDRIICRLKRGRSPASVTGIKLPHKYVIYCTECNCVKSAVTSDWEDALLINFGDSADVPPDFAERRYNFASSGLLRYGVIALFLLLAELFFIILMISLAADGFFGVIMGIAVLMILTAVPLFTELPDLVISAKKYGVYRRLI